MDEEELEQPKKKKITLSNFFESIVRLISWEMFINWQF